MTTAALLCLFALIAIILLLGEPLFVLIGAIAIYCLMASGVLARFDLLSTAIVGETRGLADNPILLAIPLFVVAGALMTEGDIARRLIEFAKSLFGFIPGGLAVAAVFACIFFAAISGSSPVTVIAIGSVMYPALIQDRYPDRFANGLVTTAGSLGILIPPSIPMIVYAIVEPTQFADPPGYDLKATGVEALFIAGVWPGMLIGLALGGYAIFVGARQKVPRIAFSGRAVVKTFLDGFWALMMPVIILGGIWTGLFSPTQAAAVSVIYAFIVEFFIHKSIKLDKIPEVLSECAVLIGTLLVVMALALGFNRYLELAQIPEAAVELIKSWDMNIFVFLIILNVLLLIVGCVMDIISAILILVPLLSAIGVGLGVHPVHLAIIFIVNLEIGYLTPPVGLNLFVSSTLFKKSIGEVARAVVPFLGLMVMCLMVITYVPGISLLPVALLNTENVTHSGVGTPESPACAPESVCRTIHLDKVPFFFPEHAGDLRTHPERTGDGEETPKVGSELDSLMDEVEADKKGGGSELDALMDEVEAEQKDKDKERDKPTRKPASELDALMDEVEAEQKAKAEEKPEEAPPAPPAPDAGTQPPDAP